MINKILLALCWFIFIVSLVFPLLKKEQYKVSKPPKVEVPRPKKPIAEQPLHNIALPMFDKISNVAEKKTAFFNFLKPVVEQENAKLLLIRQRLNNYLDKYRQSLLLEKSEQLDINELALLYKISKKLEGVNQVEALLKRVDIIPTGLVLVQAANESAWGTSRFAKIGLNFFGIWCFQKGCGMVPSGRDNGLKHEVAAFTSVEQAVNRYLHNLNTNNAYKVLRLIRAQLRQQNLPISAQMLATGLLPYSERGSDYILEISNMIRHNHRYF